MLSPYRSCLIILILTTISLSPVRLKACQICLPIPQKSLADWIIESKYVSLAQQNPKKPFSLIIDKNLKEEPARPEIDLFLDSSSRHILKTFPDRRIICIRLSDDPSQEWRRIGILTPELGPIIREILQKKDPWKEDQTLRLNYFKDFLSHPDNQIRTLAHLEVAGSPYREIRKLRDVFSSEEIHTFLNKTRYLEWHALYILLLAGSDDEQDHEMIRKKMELATRFSFTVQLAAWTTAYLEIDQEEALSFIETHYLKNPQRTPKELKAIFQALSTHGSEGHQHLRNRIVENYRLLLKSAPQLADAIVTDLEMWERWDFAEPVSEMLPSVTDMNQVLRLRAYLQKSQPAEPPLPDSESSSSESWMKTAIALLIALPFFLLLSSKIRKARAAG